jgi:hypothetical protein
MSLGDRLQVPVRMARLILAARPLRALVGALSVLVGLLAIALGAALFLSARPAQPVRVDGLIRDYRAVFVGGAYTRSELKLVDDPRTYTFDRGSFRPPLPNQLYQDGQVIVWTDGVGGPVIALTLSDEHGLNATTSSTMAYDNPDAPLWLGRSEGAGAAVLGLALAAGAPLLLTLGSRRQMRGAKPETRSKRSGRPEARQTDETLPTLERVAVEIPAVVIAGRATRPPASATSAPPMAPAARPNPNTPLPDWAAEPLGSSWAGIEAISGPTPGAPRVERSIPTYPPASGSAPAARTPAIDELPTEHTPRPQPTQPAERSYPPVGVAPPRGPLVLPRFGPGGPPSGPGASPRDVEEAPTVPTPAVAPPAEDGGAAPRRTPLWPPASDTNGQ